MDHILIDDLPPTPILVLVLTILAFKTIGLLGWLVVTQQCWTLVFVYRLLTLASVMFLDTIICARPVTLEFGLRTIPFGYLRSPNWAQISFRVSGFTGDIGRAAKKPSQHLPPPKNTSTIWEIYSRFQRNGDIESDPAARVKAGTHAHTWTHCEIHPSMILASVRYYSVPRPQPSKLYQIHIENDYTIHHILVTT